MQSPKKSYYGAFFWLSAVSFIVPVIVAVRAFDAAYPTSAPEPNPDESGVDHALWDYLLKGYVENGLVDYDGLARNHVFRTYLRQLGGANPANLRTNKEQMALYLNAYNAFVIHGVITHRITTSVMDYKVNGTGFFDLKEHVFAGRTISLNELEHKIIREQFQEPRIHFALVCAAKSCPPLRPEAYVGRCLEHQLADQTRLFCNDQRFLRYNADIRRIYLSPLLKWYGKDWDHEGGYLRWLAQRVEDPVISVALEDVCTKCVDVVFNEYDWTLNAQGEHGSGTKQQRTDFGSGSIPNE